MRHIPCTPGRASRIFFFQAEDGIRDLTVTGVQTCALPISQSVAEFRSALSGIAARDPGTVTYQTTVKIDRKSTRLNSSHSQISYAVFCLKKKKTENGSPRLRYWERHKRDRPIFPAHDYRTL